VLYDYDAKDATELSLMADEVTVPHQFGFYTLGSSTTITPALYNHYSCYLVEACEIRTSYICFVAPKCGESSFVHVKVRRIFGPQRDEVTGEWRRLHNKELYALYSSPSIIRVIKSRRLRWAGHVARMGERRGAYRALVGKPERRRPLGRRRRRWEDNIKMDLREVGWGGMDWINLAQDRDRWRALLNAVMNLRVP
jgi:hypothetical protein